MQQEWLSEARHAWVYAVYLHINMYTYMHKDMHKWLWIFKYVCICTQTSTSLHICPYVAKHARGYACLCIYIYMCVCVCVMGMLGDFSGHTEVTIYPESTIPLWKAVVLASPIPSSMNAGWRATQLAYKQLKDTNSSHPSEPWTHMAEINR